jgi:hypothetical protein
VKVTPAKVTPEQQVTVTIKLPDAQCKMLEVGKKPAADSAVMKGSPNAQCDKWVGASLTIDEIPGRGFFDLPIFAVLLDLAGPNLSKAQEMARAAIGATRSLDAAAEITLPGAIGTAPQTVDGSRPLIWRWNGGTPPFRIELASAGTTPHQVVETSERTQRLDLSSDPTGNGYTLTIVGTNDVRLTLPLHVVDATDVPVVPGIEAAAQDPEARELVEAVWLLTRAPMTWRLEALSRLEFLARDHDNIVAQAIVDPAPSPDGQTDR